MKRVIFFLLFLGISQSYASNFYWVGGSGVWTDLNHWATSSGGAIHPVSLPTSTDDVFFDANSFSAASQVVTLVSSDQYCNNMSWAGVTNNPEFNLGSAKMHVYGSLTLNATMILTNTLQVSAGFYFDASTAGKTIQTFGKTLYYDVFFRGTATASWTLLDELHAFDRIYVQGGILNTGNQNITMMSAQGEIYFDRMAFSGAPVVANLGNSTLTASLVQSNYAVLGITINPGTSTLAIKSLYSSGQSFYDVVFNGSGAVGFTSITNSGGNYHNIDVNSGTDFSMEGGTTISGRLRFAVPGMTYLISSASTTTITGVFELPNTVCGAFSILHSTVSGSQATINVSGGTVNASRFGIKDIVAAGAASYTATNSADEGNNSGWSFSTNSPQNFYWIGGTGSWNDGTKWSLSSGGAIANCTPSPVDNVFFDANSFSAAGQIVSLASGDKYCNNMSWAGATNNPEFSFSAAKMHVYGSLTLNATMILTNTLLVNAGFYFDAKTAGQTIQTFGKTLYYDVYFRGTATASWTLLDELHAFDRIYVEGGTLNTGNQNITMMSSQGEIYFNRFSFAGAPVVANLGGSTLTASYISSSLTSFGVTINPGTSTLAVKTFEAGDHDYFTVIFNGSGVVGFVNDVASDGGSYNKIYVMGGTQFTLEGSRTINGVLGFEVPGMSYLIESGSTTTINGIFELPNTSCGAFSVLHSTISGSQATFNVTSGTVVASRFGIKDIVASGAASYTATNSADEGNNSGWSFSANTPQNYYWVGGTGNWNDGTKWSLTSGGTAVNCTPSTVDNVFFDANSFSTTGQIVTLVSSDKYCNNMSWAGVTNNPEFNLGAAKMHVYGSLTLNATMILTNTLQVNAGFYFDASTAGKTIQTFGKTLYYDVFFRGTATASWTLLDELHTFDRIYVQGGILNTGNQNITMMSSQGEIYFDRMAFAGAPVVANLGSSTLTASLVQSNYAALGITINPGTSTLAIKSLSSAEQSFYDVVFNGSGAVGFTSNTNSAGQYHNIDVNSGTGFTMEGGATINGRLRFAVPDLNVSFPVGSTTYFNGVLESYGTVAQRVNIFSASNGSPVLFQKSNALFCIEYVTLRDITKSGAASFYASNSIDLGNNTGWNFTAQTCLAVLPIQLMNFDIQCNNGNLVFYWKTAKETNGSYFEIQKLVNSSWTSLGIVKAVGESQLEHSYNFQSEEQAGMYRLVSVNKDGGKQYSNIKIFHCGKTVNALIVPNPVEQDMELMIISNKNERVEYLINNLLGQPVQKASIWLSIGFNRIPINVSQLIPGTYIFSLPSVERKFPFVKLR